MQEWEKYKTYEDAIRNSVIRNEKLSLDGVVLDAKIEYRPIGVYITLTIDKAPDTWTEYEKNSLMDAIGDGMGATPELRYRINGEDAQTPESLNYGKKDTIFVLLPVFPSDYTSVSSLTMELMLHRIVAVNGEEPSDDWSWDFNAQGSYASPVRVSEPLTTFEIPIPKIN